MQSDKFEEEMHGRYGLWLETITKSTSLTDKIGRLLSKHHADDDFLPTAIQFAKVCVETPDAIIRLAKSGDIAPSYVLLRWYLEQCHLLWYLWKNPDQYKKWLSKTRITPGEIGRYFESVSLQTWRDSYVDWCNVVHGNAPYLERYSLIARRSPKDEGQVLILGQILFCVAVLTQKMNMFLVDTVHSVAKQEEWVSLEPMFREINQSLDQMSAEQQRVENTPLKD